MTADAGVPQLSHDVLFYGSDEQFTASVVPFILEGLRLDQPVTAAVARHNIALLHGALGADATRVTFIDRDGWYRRPASTIAGWRQLLAAANAEGRRHVRLIGEIGFGPAAQHPVWTRYEAALNRVFADAPAWIVCPYDTRALPAPLLAEARRVHPTVRDPLRRDSDAYLPAEEFLRAVPDPLPPVFGEPSLRLTISENVAAVRHAIAGYLAASGRSAWPRLGDLLLAIHEISANAIRHGRGLRELRLWDSDRAIVCEVTDEGNGPTDPLAGYRPSDPEAAGGHGLWLARQLCDQLAVDTAQGKTRIRFAMDTAAPTR